MDARDDPGTGVYALINTADENRCYIGSASVSFKQRMDDHLTALRNGRHWNRHVQRAYDRDGATAFMFIVVARCHPADCKRKEQQYLDAITPYLPSLGYNISMHARVPPLGSSCSEATRARISASKRGKPLPPRSPEMRAKIAARRKGCKHSEETKALIAAKGRGRVPDEAHRKAVSVRHKGKIVPPEVRAKIKATKAARGISAETREKLAASQRGRTKSPEEIAKISASKRGKPGWKWSPEQAEQRASKLRGRKLTDDHRKKLSESHKGKKQPPEMIAKRVASSRATRERKRREAVAATEPAAPPPPPAQRLLFEE